MYKFVKQSLSILLVIVLLINLLPASAVAIGNSIAIDEASDAAMVVATPFERGSTAQIVEEDTSKRGEYYKEFVLNNGLRMATVYPDAVHYEVDGKWEEIDNTLKVSGSSYVNTAGKWAVSFPQKLNSNNAVTIQKDGYTLSFYMAGELRSSNTGNLERASLAAPGTVESFSVQTMQTVSAQIETIDILDMQSAIEHPEIIPEKSQSRLQYSNVYSGTNVVYDLSSNRVKESIIMQSYSANLRGYRYTLNVGELKPVLNDSGEIYLYDRAGEDVVMVMPAPFLVDDAGEYCDDITVQLTGSGSSYMLTYLLPQDWLADEHRQWPVVLDPMVDADITRSNIRDVSVYEKYGQSYNNATFLDIGHDQTYGITRAFLKYDNLPPLTSADVVVDARLTMCKYDTNIRANAIEIHKVEDTWKSETLTWQNKPNYNPTIEDYVVAMNSGWYQWTITDVVRDWYASGNTGLMLKAPDWVEAIASNLYYRKQFYSSDNGAEYRPMLTITFRNNNGLESYWDYTASTAGRAGTGYVNNYTGNLVWVHNDIGYGGNLMPVSISQSYNANDKDDCPFGFGYGWRTNYNQTVTTCTLRRTVNGVVQDVTYYVWEDADGTKHYFYKTADNTYQDEDGLDLTITTKGNGYACELTDKQGNKSYFDSNGRLYKLENNQQIKSNITITYVTNTGKHIATITDGAGRVYRFDSSGGFIRRISYLGTGDTEIGYIAFSYSNGCPTTITYQDGETIHYEYDTSHLLTAAEDIDGYRLEYTYHPVGDGTWQPYRVNTVSEHDDTEAGGMLTIQYGHNQTTFTDHNGNVQIMQFNNWGNTVSIQDNQGRAQFATYSPVVDQTDKGNQLSISSKLQNTVGNMLQDSSFENGTTRGSVNGVSQEIVSGTAYLGAKSLKFTNHLDTYYSGISLGTFTAKAGESYTFSAYVKTASNANAYLSVWVDNVVLDSETLPEDTDWTRMEFTYTNNTADDTAFNVRVLSATCGSVYVDCVQLEKAETASRYNIIENGDFRYGVNSWTTSQRCDTDDIPVSLPASAAVQLENTAFQFVGDPRYDLRIQQNVPVSGAKDDVYVLAGWAKGNGVPLPTKQEKEAIIEAGEHLRTFTIRGTFLYTDGTTGEFDFDFNPDQPNWQYAAGVMVAEKAFNGIKVQLLYDYNANTVYFDGIQLYKEEFGNSYTYDDDGNVTSVKDLQGKITSYEYADNNTDLLQVIQDNKAKLTYEYDNWHNVKTATTEEGITYSFTYDEYGNNTSVSILYNGSSITSTADYSDDGNLLESTTDAEGKITRYGYNPDTNLLEWVQSPNDSESSRTNYTYDTMHRLASVSANVDGLSEGTALTASYTYADDLLTSVATESTTYTFAYGDFALRSSIKIGSRTLAEYSYTDDGNYYLSALDYGNGDKVQYSYDEYGRLVAELYEDGDKVTYKYDNSGGLAAVHDSASGVTTKYYYDVTDRLMKYTETGTDYTHSVAYTYDDLNNLTALKDDFNGSEWVTSYTYDDDNRVTQMNRGIVIRNYTYDGYSRLSSRITRHGGSPIVTDTFTFGSSSDTAHSGQIETHNISAPDGYNVTYTYDYDGNGNIISVSNGVTTTTYVYDTQNQLRRENNQAYGKTWTWAYDNAGNITSRNEYAYTTGELGDPLDTVIYGYTDPAWGDLLTSYDGTAIAYDTIGNPLYDGTWTYTWEHGRRLASMTDGTTTWSYSYNSDGLRTGRTDGTNTYQYVYTDGQLSAMYYEGTRYLFHYEGSTPVAMYIGNTAYYYAANINGDVVAIFDNDGNRVVEYTYDAWGNILSVSGSMADTIGAINPLRYRGYVYDQETELYYLQSRYYNPQIGRFLNADGYVSTGQGFIGNNMFAYCLNNPICLVDASGAFSIGGILETAPGWLAVAAAITACLDGPLPVADILAAATIVAVGLTCTSSTSQKEEVVAEAAVATGSTPSGPYSVYFLCKAGDPNKTIVYVGRVKTANFDARMAYHKTKGRALVNSIGGLEYDECRGIEQAGMMHHHTINRGQPLYNQIRGVSPFNENRHSYFIAARDFCFSNSYSNTYLPSSYWENVTENEFLNFGM